MPIYDFKCESCDEIVEITKSYKELDKPTPCGRCGEEMVKLPPTQTTFVLKGKCWARDGYQ